MNKSNLIKKLEKIEPISIVSVGNNKVVELISKDDVMKAVKNETQ